MGCEFSGCQLYIDTEIDLCAIFVSVVIWQAYSSRPGPECFFADCSYSDQVGCSFILKVWDQGPGKYLHFGNRDLIRNSRWIDVLQPLDGLERFAMPSIARRERPFPQVDLIDDQRVGGGFL